MANNLLGLNTAMNLVEAFGGVELLNLGIFRQQVGSEPNPATDPITQLFMYNEDGTKTILWANPEYTPPGEEVKTKHIPNGRNVVSENQNNETDWWSSFYNRINTGDAVSISVDFAGSIIQGKNIKVELIFFMQGPDKFSFKPQITSGKVKGVDASIGVQLNKYFYTGRLENFTKGSFNGETDGLDLGVKMFDFGLSKAQDNYGNYIYGGSFGVSMGSPLGFTYGSGYSEPLMFNK